MSLVGRPLSLRVVFWSVSVIAATGGAAAAPGTQVSFSKDIQPIFEQSCWKCHSGTVQLSKLDLRTREAALTGGTRGPALSPGNPDASRLYRVVAGLEKPVMPIGGKLTGEQIDSVRRWIEQGAPWDAVVPAQTSKGSATDLEAGEISPEARAYWAFQKPVRPNVPDADGKHRHPIDAFLWQAMRDKGLNPAPQADAVTLVRRAHLDLIGLPPSPAEVSAYLKDTSPKAWERLIDRLLASPHYGEKWGRHWLDVARYADSNGYEHDFDRPNAWRYRDYVTESFNKDTPYDRFIREQIAGDEIDRVTNNSLIATGFLRNYAKVGYREKDNPEFRYEYLDDMIATIGRGILGLTVQCARCHNHKFDPILQKDYYRLQASLFGYVEVDHSLAAPEVTRAYEARMAAVNAQLNELRARVREIEKPYRDVVLQKKYKTFPANVQAAIAAPEAQRTPGQVLLANQVIRTVSASSAEVDALMKPEDLGRKKQLQAQAAEIEKTKPEPIPVAMGITDGDYRFTPDGPGDEPAPGKGLKQDKLEGSYLHKGHGPYVPPPSYFLIRGDVNSKGSVMQPGFVIVATYGNPPVARPPADGHTSGRRRALADWLVSPDNPLTARVMINRIWHHHFGHGIVATIDNFGKMGDAPTNTPLLDWLALEFIERGWSMKEMHRLIMTSDAYRMSSSYSASANLERDPQNKLLWKFPARRLEAETIRDSILAVSGALNREVGGPPVFPELQPEVLSQMTHGIWKKEPDSPKVWRRSLYIYRKRGLPFPMLESFDLPDQNISCGARAVTTVPTQALMLMNDEWVVRQSELFAQRVIESEPKDRGSQIDLAYRLALGRSPNRHENELASEYLSSHSFAGFAHVLLNLNEFVYLR